MKAKVCIVLIAIVVLLGVFSAVACERVQAGEISVSDTQHHATVLASNNQVYTDQAVTAAASDETALLSNKTTQISTWPARGQPSRNYYEQEYADEDLGYSYAYYRTIAKPPAFNGLGGDHFARADV